MRENGTERAFSSPLNSETRRGVYACAACGQPLFRSAAKFDAGTGWPSFSEPLMRGDGKVVAFRDSVRDRLRGRRAVRCAQCGSHLGHVFHDAPAQPTGNRFCINGVTLAFTPTGGG